MTPTPTPRSGDPDAPLNLDEEARRRVKHRLRRLEGQVRGLQQMIDDDRSCRDVLTLLAGVRSALAATGDVILEKYVSTCAADLTNDPDQARDLLAVVKLARG
jgi:DNA-binding FrmR family transcriptional regulator